ncbi:LPXTG-site transpeptidase (sortase) family protein [Raineyella antarctica]|uniref:LPXTG-site transpeptidase (Sortase) family protein n=1 Tax=Raineyella antarctica TaxID=1577474 RepID=A0A1G6GFF4_9ACTN|nr:class F sortase [Raineyella antarctica]SDB80731.1 LPXTG-site transpeptidase (sortase) family protein [Raineyella antarctica]
MRLLSHRGARLPTWLLMVLGALVLVGGPSAIVWAGYLSSTAVAVPAAPAASTDPLHLTIDSLGIRNAQVLPMAMEGAALNPPDNPRMVGWWNHSADAGADRGTTLLTSHKVEGGNGVFEHLVQVQPGAEIMIHGETGSFTYVVRDVRVLHKDQLAAEAPQLFSQDGPHRLVLVTCEDWDGHGFTANSVVVATPKGDPVAN